MLACSAPLCAQVVGNQLVPLHMLNDEKYLGPANSFSFSKNSSGKYLREAATGQFCQASLYLDRTSRLPQPKGIMERG